MGLFKLPARSRFYKHTRDRDVRASFLERTKSQGLGPKILRLKTHLFGRISKMVASCNLFSILHYSLVPLDPVLVMRRPGWRQRTCANNKHMTAPRQCRPRALIALISLFLPAASECADFNASFTEVSLSSDYLKSGTHVLALGESILNDTTAVVRVCSAQSALLDPKSKDLSPDTSDCEYIFRLWLPVILAIVLGAVLLAPCLCAHDTTSAASVWGLQSRVELSLLPPCRNHPFTEGCYVCGSKSARYDCFHSFHSSMSCKLSIHP